MVAMLYSTTFRPSPSVQHLVDAQQCWMNKLKLNSIAKSSTASLPCQHRGRGKDEDKPSSPGMHFHHHTYHTALRPKAYSSLVPRILNKVLCEFCTWCFPCDRKSCTFYGQSSPYQNGWAHFKDPHACQRLGTWQLSLLRNHLYRQFGSVPRMATHDRPLCKNIFSIIVYLYSFFHYHLFYPMPPFPAFQTFFS